MVKGKGKRILFMAVAGFVGFLLVQGCLNNNPNTELAKTTREAVQMAHEAQSDGRSAVLWAGRYRMLSLIIGVSVPLVVVYLIWRSSSNSPIDAMEVIEYAETHMLSSSDSDKVLPGNQATASD